MQLVGVVVGVAAERTAAQPVLVVVAEALGILRDGQGPRRDGRPGAGGVPTEPAQVRRLKSS